MELQLIFDKVKTHLLTQKTRSYDEITGCLYRDSKGNKCAVGCLISDEAYHEDLEGHLFCEKKVEKALTISGLSLTPEVRSLLKALQLMHDTLEVESWPRILPLIAEQFSLVYTE